MASPLQQQQQQRATKRLWPALIFDAAGGSAGGPAWTTSLKPPLIYLAPHSAAVQHTPHYRCRPPHPWHLPPSQCSIAPTLEVTCRKIWPQLQSMLITIVPARMAHLPHPALQLHLPMHCQQQPCIAARRFTSMTSLPHHCSQRVRERAATLPAPPRSTPSAEENQRLWNSPPSARCQV
jgi:hypothetical protein